MYLWLYFIPIIIILGAQALVKSAYNRYRAVKNEKGLTGFDVARKILDMNDLKDIHIVETKGLMGDHYDPKRKVIRLSKEVFHNNSIASIAIAAHECGHAIQHKEKYLFIRIRSFLVPFVNFTSKIGYVILFIGFFASLLDLAFIGLMLLATTLLFQLVTLPVEFDASKRAHKIMVTENFTSTNESNQVKSMLTAAALTYVASLIANLLEILRLFLMLRDR
ncbi:MAG: zinc metallopeptidase [Bacilli bacterium]|jgi:hypothetical protein|nr:zinc metallopeptidase [Bacilli bacterium]